MHACGANILTSFRASCCSTSDQTQVGQGIRPVQGDWTGRPGVRPVALPLDQSPSHFSEIEANFVNYEVLDTIDQVRYGDQRHIYFDLPISEATITSHDVAFIWGSPIEGDISRYGDQRHIYFDLPISEATVTSHDVAFIWGSPIEEYFTWFSHMPGPMNLLTVGTGNKWDNIIPKDVMTEAILQSECIVLTRNVLFFSNLLQSLIKSELPARRKIQIDGSRSEASDSACTVIEGEAAKTYCTCCSYYTRSEQRSLKEFQTFKSEGFLEGMTLKRACDLLRIQPAGNKAR
ncbi:hypothetical protein DH2020_002705 [Rehmannia glutinosa]|uniref:Uncharacterized protein n=1 Tax=Rehmannia glutinosa TaxID=99300 RepID=A0ABR0XUS6_REHGL